MENKHTNDIIDIFRDAMERIGGRGYSLDDIAEAIEEVTHGFLMVSFNPNWLGYKEKGCKNEPENETQEQKMD